MLSQLGVKVLFFPSVLSRFPFSSLLFPPLGSILGRWILPLFLAGLSVGAAWIYLKRARSRSTLIAYLVYAAVDSILTLAIYIALPFSQSW